ncbi:proteasome assembly chaperone (PAC2) family protein [Motilibacter rhizosphaerae]|uniref:Proteasome assembly chaperone (PAC2) family protein n=1 Tax=Motilibacter rhizosphaerae TaxID=598652 RepID=A0A4Q7NB02_9ACTN|nr:PAC2 family protein [Motilibacter rhizosphaerae]RZS80055.1 proteasome assembly chaperone (PAC2) family protein [Motilibacter rhizosphaerae]
MIELESVPELVDPVLIAAFEGWNDAGEAATGAVEHLEQVWQAVPLGAIDPDDYYDFQVNRPMVSVDAEGERTVTWPTSRFSWARLPGSGRDVVLLRGIEPNMRWRAFTDEILAVAADLGVEMVVTLGALLADAPHTRPIPVTGTATDQGLARQLDLEVSRYEGPTGIVGVLQERAGRVGMPSVSLWAAVPHYVAQPPSPKATLALLRGVEDLLDLSVELGELPEDARAWEHGVDELAAEDSEVADYVRTLEEAKDTAELPEASGEAIAREFERYLRRRGPGASGPRDPGR